MPSFRQRSSERRSSRRIGFCATAFFVVILATAPAMQGQKAEPGTLFAVQGNGIFRVDIGGGSSAGPVNDITGLVALRDLAVRDRGDRIDVIVTHHIDASSAELILYSGLDAGDPVASPVDGMVIAPGLVNPEGLSLGVGGTLYFVDNPDGPGVPKIVRLLRAASVSGYGVAEVVDDNPPSNRLADTQIVTFRAGPIFPGDLLVLSQDPPAILRYRLGQPCLNTTNCSTAERRPLPFPLPGGVVPTSFVFLPTGDFLIATDDGRIFRYRLDDGTVDIAPFAQDLGAGIARLVAGIQDSGGSPTAFLFYANNGQGEIVRFDAQDGSMSPMNPFPFAGVAGIGIGTGRAAPTRPGGGVRIQPRESVVATFDAVVKAGYTSMRTRVFGDPRGMGDLEPLWLCDPAAQGCAAPPGSFFVPLGHSNFISSSVRPLPNVPPPPGLASAPFHFLAAPRLVSEQFMLIEVTSTAGFVDTTKLQALEEVLLGHDIPHCDDAIFVEQPRLFHCADEDDAPTPYGPECYDVSTGCGSNFGRPFEFSSFIVARDLSSRRQLAQLKLARLLAALSPMTPPGSGGLASFIDQAVLSELLALAASALTKVDSSDFLGANVELELFVQAVRESGLLIDNSQQNVRGALLTWPISTIFINCGGTDCSPSVDNHAEDVGEIFADGFEAGDPDAWAQQVP